MYFEKFKGSTRLQEEGSESQMRDLKNIQKVGKIDSSAGEQR